MKSLFLGIFAIVLLGIGGLLYRNALEYPMRGASCALDVRVCPDGTSVSRTGISCTFAECAPPNTTLSVAGIAYAVPHGFVASVVPDEESLAAYELSATSTTQHSSSIVIKKYVTKAPLTALSTIQETAISSPSGLPAPTTSFTSQVVGEHRVTIVSIERFEGVVHTAYYLARGSEVLRFDAIDRGVINWTDSHLDISSLPAHAGVQRLLATLQYE